MGSNTTTKISCYLVISYIQQGLLSTTPVNEHLYVRALVIKSAMTVFHSNIMNTPIVSNLYQERMMQFTCIYTSKMKSSVR